MKNFNELNSFLAFRIYFMTNNYIVYLTWLGIIAVWKKDHPMNASTP
jgi:hypothetical protein